MANSDWPSVARTYPRREAAGRFYEYCKQGMFPELARCSEFVSPAAWIGQASIADGDDKCVVRMYVYSGNNGQAIRHTVTNPDEMRGVFTRCGIPVSLVLNVLAEEYLLGETT